MNRQRVLDRIRRRGLPITALVAPAGYGKSYIAQRIARVEPRWAEVNCAAGDGAPAFAERLAAALDVGDDTAIDRTRSRRIADAWRNPAQPLALILENVDGLESEPEARGLVTSLLTECPLESKLILCARRYPDNLLSGRDAPHMMTTMRAEQLAFDDTEMHALFAEANVSESLLYRISRFTEGWPVPALACERLAREGDFEAIFDRVDRAAFADLFDYVDDQVLMQLPKAVLRALCAVAGFDDLRTEELDRFYSAGGGHRISADLTRHFQVARADGQRSSENSPVTRAVVRDRHALEVREAQLELAGSFMEAHEVERAAQCYLQAGDIARAAELLQDAAHGDTLDPVYIFSRLPEAYDAAVLSCYPQIWAALIGARRLSEHPDVLVNEASIVLKNLPPDATGAFRNTIVALTAVTQIDAGRLADARAMLESGATGSATDSEDAGQLNLKAARATLDAAEGAFDAALSTWHAMQRHVLAKRTWFSQLIWIEIEAARARGQWEVEYVFIERMLESARLGGALSITGIALGEGVFGAWLAGEEEFMVAYCDQLTVLMQQHALPAMLNFNLAAHGRRLSPSRTFSSTWDAKAYIMAAVRAEEPQRAAEYAQAALALADQSGMALLRVLSRVAVVEKMPTSRGRRLPEAIAIARTIDSEVLSESLERLAATGEPDGMLTSFVNKLRSRSAGFEKADEDLRLSIWLSDGTVDRDGSRLNVSEGGLALLAALAVDGRPVARDVLCDRLWPEMPIEPARNALKMCVRRTRLQIGDAAAIVSADGGYTLAPSVQVDVRELERLRTGSARGAFEAGELTRARKLFERLMHGRPRSLLERPWFETFEHWLQSTASRLGDALARTALREGDNPGARRIGEFLIKLDPFDEAPRNVSISAHLAERNRGAAISEYRQYRRVLKDELGVEPSEELKLLFGGRDAVAVIERDA